MPDLTHLDALLKQTRDNITTVNSWSNVISNKTEILHKLYTTKRALENVREMLLHPDIASMPWGSPI